MYSVYEKPLVENQGGHWRKNFAKQEFVVEHVKLFLVKHNSNFGAGYYNRKNNIFPFTDSLYLISFLKKNPEEKNF